MAASDSKRRRAGEIHYDEDLAYIHHVGFGAFARESSPGLLAMLAGAGIAGGRVVDLACGSGIWAAELLAAGYEVIGVDISPAMLKLARRQAPEAQFRQASLWEAEIPPCDAVTCISEGMNYLADERAGEKSLAPLFERVAAALRPGGLFVFDVRVLRALKTPDLRHPHSVGDGWAVICDIEENPARRLLTREITAFRQRGGHYRRSEELHRQFLYDAARVAAALRSAGFRVRRLRGYGARRFVPGHLAFAARRLPRPAGHRR